MFLTAGCLALVVGSACYSNGVLYCSDLQVGNLPTCQEFNRQTQAAMDRAKARGCMSQDGSTSSCVWDGPQIPTR